jgi:hypothetical protein
MWEGRFDAAQLLFERAARCYREETRVEPLARLRVHQLMAQVRSGAVPRDADSLTLEVERRLCRLSRIESLSPPFALVDARELLASWITAPSAGSSLEHESLRPAA